MPMATLLAAADHANIDGDDGQDRPRRPTSQALAEAGIDSTTSPTSCCATASTSSSSRWRSCSPGWTSKREAIVTAAAPVDRGVDPRRPRAADRRQGHARRPSQDVGHRIWRKDPTLWGGDASTPELADRLGWLTVTESMREHLDDLLAFAAEVRDEGTTDVVLLGMGGSSLAPEVIRRSFGEQEGWPGLHVLDSTDAGAIAAVRDAVDLDHTAVPRLDEVGRDDRDAVAVPLLLVAAPGRAAQFVAITDEGSGLQKLAEEHGFRRTFLNDPEIGGRYSALSYFGLVPAALMGADVTALLDRAGVAEQMCLTFDSSSVNSGLWLGLAWGELAAAGHDKLTYVIDPPLRQLRPLGRAADRRVDGQGGQGHPARGRRAARRRPASTATTARSCTCARRTARPRAPGGRRRAGRADQPVIIRAIDGPRGPRADLLRRRVRRSPSPAGCWASTRSTSPTCRRPRTRRSACSTQGTEDQPDADDDALRALLAGLDAPGYLADPRLRRARRRVRRGGRRAARRRPRRHARRDDVRLRAPLPALDRPAAQGRPGDRPLPAARPRQRRGHRDPERRLRRSRASSTRRRSATSRPCATTACRPSA